MKLFSLLSVAASVTLIAGCSQRPMLLTNSVSAEKPIVIKEKSSDALRFLHDQGVYTVRDLTKDEFEGVEDDVAEYMKANQVFNSSSDGGVGYSASSVAVGTGLGLSINFASSLSVIGMLSNAGNGGYEGRNYPFAWDFHSSHFLMKKNGSIDIDLLGDTAEKVVNKYAEKMTGLYKTTITKSRGLNKSESKWIPDTDVSYSAVTNFKRSDRARVRGAVVVRFQCPVKGENAGQFCKASFSIRSVNDRYPLANAMREEFMRTLGGDYAVYIPPNTAYYNVPAVLHGDGKVEFLVER